jgi:Rod binding domain-containing protein
MDGISSATDLAASSWTLPNSGNSAVIPENQTFHEAFQNASEKTDTPEKIAGVAKQFEALMIGQILKSAREASGGGWLENGDGQDDQTGSMVMELGEQGLSQALAAHGGLGIAKMVTANLERHSAAAADAAKTASSGSEAPAPQPLSSLRRETSREKSLTTSMETQTTPNAGLKRR